MATASIQNALTVKFEIDAGDFQASPASLRYYTITRPFVPADCFWISRNGYVGGESLTFCVVFPPNGEIASATVVSPLGALPASPNIVRATEMDDPLSIQPVGAQIGLIASGGADVTRVDGHFYLEVYAPSPGTEVTMGVGT